MSTTVLSILTDCWMCSKPASRIWGVPPFSSVLVANHLPLAIERRGPHHLLERPPYWQNLRRQDVRPVSLPHKKNRLACAKRSGMDVKCNGIFYAFGLEGTVCRLHRPFRFYRNNNWISRPFRPANFLDRTLARFEPRIQGRTEGGAPAARSFTGDQHAL